MSDLNAYWPEILDIVRQKVAQQTFNTWFAPLQPENSGNGSLKVACPNHFFMDWFSEHHLGILNEAGSACFGRDVSFALQILDGAPNELTPLTPEPEERPAAAPGRWHRRRAPGAGRRAFAAGRPGAEPESGLHVREFRGGLGHGHGVRRGHRGGPQSGQPFQPAVHPRRGGAGQDPPDARGGQRHRRRAPGSAHRLRHGRELHERPGRFHPRQQDTRLQAEVPQRRRAAGGRRGLPGRQGVAPRRSSSTPSTRSTT